MEVVLFSIFAMRGRPPDISLERPAPVQLEYVWVSGDWECSKLPGEITGQSYVG